MAENFEFNNLNIIPGGTDNDILTLSGDGTVVAKTPFLKDNTTLVTVTVADFNTSTNTLSVKGNRIHLSNSAPGPGTTYGSFTNTYGSTYDVTVVPALEADAQNVNHMALSEDGAIIVLVTLKVIHVLKFNPAANPTTQPCWDLVLQEHFTTSLFFNNNSVYAGGLKLLLPTGQNIGKIIICQHSFTTLVTPGSRNIWELELNISAQTLTLPSTPYLRNLQAVQNDTPTFVDLFISPDNNLILERLNNGSNGGSIGLNGYNGFAPDCAVFENTIDEGDTFFIDSNSTGSMIIYHYNIGGTSWTNTGLTLSSTSGSFAGTSNSININTVDPNVGAIPGTDGDIYVRNEGTTTKSLWLYNTGTWNLEVSNIYNARSNYITNGNSKVRYYDTNGATIPQDAWIQKTPNINLSEPGIDPGIGSIGACGAVIKDSNGVIHAVIGASTNVFVAQNNAYEGMIYLRYSTGPTYDVVEDTNLKGTIFPAGSGNFYARNQNYTTLFETDGEIRLLFGSGRGQADSAINYLPTTALYIVRNETQSIWERREPFTNLLNVGDNVYGFNIVSNSSNSYFFFNVELNVGNPGIGVISRKNPVAVTDGFTPAFTDNTKELCLNVRDGIGGRVGSGTDDPTNISFRTGAIGEFYLYTTTNTLYEFIGTEWVSVGILIGGGTISSPVGTFGRLTAGVGLGTRPVSGSQQGEIFIDSTSNQGTIYEWAGSVWVSYSKNIFNNIPETGQYGGTISSVNGSSPGQFSYIGSFYIDNSLGSNNLFENIITGTPTWQVRGTIIVGGTQSLVGSNGGKISAGVGLGPRPVSGSQTGEFYIDTTADQGALYEWDGTNWVSYSRNLFDNIEQVGENGIGKDSIFGHTNLTLNIDTPPILTTGSVTVDAEKGCIKIPSGQATGSYSLDYSWTTSQGFTTSVVTVTFDFNVLVSCETFTITNDDFSGSSVDVTATVAARTLDILTNDTITPRSRTEVSVSLVSNITPPVTISTAAGLEGAIIIDPTTFVGLYTNQVSYNLTDTVGVSCPAQGPGLVTFHVTNSSFTPIVMANVASNISPTGGTIEMLNIAPIDLGGRDKDNEVCVISFNNGGASEITLVGNDVVVTGPITPGVYNVTYEVQDKNTNPYTTVAGGPYTLAITVTEVFTAMTLVDDPFGSIARTELANPYIIVTNDNLGGRDATNAAHITFALTVNPDPTNIMLSGPNSSQLTILSGISLGDYTVTYQATDNTTFGQAPQTADITFSIYEKADNNGDFDDGNPIGTGMNYTLIDNTGDLGIIFVRSPPYTVQQVIDILLQNYTGDLTTTITPVLEDVLRYWIKKGEEVYLEQTGKLLATTRPLTNTTVTFTT